MQSSNRLEAQSGVPDVGLPQPRVWANAPGSFSPRSTSRLAVVALLVALVAVTALNPTVMTAMRLRSDLSAEETRSMELRSEFKADMAAADERLAQSVESNAGEIDDLRESLRLQQKADFDPQAVVTLIDDAVFTIVSGNAQGSGFGLSSYGETT